MLVNNFLWFFDIETGGWIIGWHCILKQLFKYERLSNYKNKQEAFATLKFDEGKLRNAKTFLRLVVSYIILNLALISFVTMWLFQGLNEVVTLNIWL